MVRSSQVKLLMRQLIGVMKDKGLKASSYLKPGLHPEEISELTKGVIELPEDLVDFYEATDGTDVSGTGDLLDEDIEIMYGYTILPLHEALFRRERFIRRLDENLTAWMKHAKVDVLGWLPIFSEASSYYFVDVNRHSSGLPSVFWVSKAEDPEVAYFSLESMLRSIIACFEENAYVIENSHVVSYNQDIELAVTKRYNPEIDVK